MTKGQNLWDRMVAALDRVLSEPRVTMVLHAKARSWCSYELRYTHSTQVAELHDHHGWLMGTWDCPTRENARCTVQAWLDSRSYDQLLNPVFDRRRTTA